MKITEKYGVSIINVEQKQLMRQFKVTDEDEIENLEDPNYFLNYRRLSETLGLHKDSFNYLNKVHS